MDVKVALGGDMASALGPLPVRPPAGSSSASLQQAAQDFEAYFIGVLMQEMNKTLQDGGLFGGSSLGGYRGLIDDALAKRAAQAGGMGLARQLLAQWEAQGLGERPGEKK